MEHNDNKYESCIIGKANVCFGGKVSVSSGITHPYNLPSIGLSELYEDGEPGRDLSPKDLQHAPQVWLIFDDMRSIDIMQRHLDNCRDLLKRMAEDNAKSEQQTKPSPTGILGMEVVDLDFSMRILNTFRAYNIKTVADIVRLHKTDVLKFRNFGKHSFYEVDDFLEEHGLHWGMDI